MVYELLHEFPNDLTVRILRNQERSGKSSSQSSSQNYNFVNTSKKPRYFPQKLVFLSNIYSIIVDQIMSKLLTLRVAYFSVLWCIFRPWPKNIFPKKTSYIFLKKPLIFWKRKPRKIFLISQEMAFSTSSIKKFQETKSSKRFFMFQETETLKRFLYLRKSNFLASTITNLP